MKVLGEGGMGTVYLAEHTLIKRRVAIKILHPQFASDANVVERFMNEARAAGTLGHPNIVESTDMGFTHDHVPYIVFEYLEGALLTDEIYRTGGLPMVRAVRVAEQVAAALRAAHDAGIVHRDLKSDNIFLTDKDELSDHVKVLDFGISRFMAHDERHPGMVMGTPEFMAPEQITNPEGVDRRADIYALGVILYEMLTARRPFAADKDIGELQRRIIQDAPPPLEREVPHALQELIVGRMLAKDPAARPQTMAAVEVALEAFLTRSDGTPIPRRRSQPIEVVDPAEIARTSGTIPRPHGMLNTPYPGIPAAGTAPVGKVPDARRKSIVLYSIAGVSLLLGVAGIGIGLKGSHNAAPVAQQPAPAPAATLPAPAPEPREPAKVDVQIDSDVATAHVVFRRRASATPMHATITPSDIVELVELSAPGYKTERYWLTFDRTTHLKAHLARGSGFEEATEEQTLVALGEGVPEVPAAKTVVKVHATDSAPARAVEVAVVAPTQVMARRKIGRSAVTEALPDTTVAVETVERPRARVAQGAAAIETAPVAAPAAPMPVAEAPKKVETAPEPAWAPKAETPAAPMPAAPAAKVAVAPLPAPRAAEAAHIVAPSVLKSLLASSSTIEPSEAVQAQMMRDEKKKATAVIKVCIGTGGEVTAATVAKSSGYTQYDTALVAGVRGWHYRPFAADGHAAPACSAVVFAFAIQ
ncbi:MAG TPA: TonB family protein [Kofleriaceae bacterium]